MATARRNLKSEAKKHIAIVYTGGTMGSEESPGGARRTITCVDQFRAVYRSVLDMFPNVTISYVLSEPKDSTERDWRSIERLYARVAKLNGNADAILVIHGTDSLGYAASYLSFGLLAETQGLRTPVILTGSQTPAGSRRRPQGPSDAYNNLALALKAGLEADRLHIADVLVAFGSKILRGITAAKVTEVGWEAFDSPGFRNVGLADARAFGTGRPTIFVELCRRRFSAAGELPIACSFRARIPSFVTTTNLPASAVMATLDSKPSPDGIVLVAMGEGNVRSTGPDSLIPVITKAKQKGVPILLVSPFAGGAVSAENLHYPPGLRALKAGAIPCGPMPVSAVVGKLAFLFGGRRIPDLGTPKAIAHVRKYFAANMVGELTGYWPGELR